MAAQSNRGCCRLSTIGTYEEEESALVGKDVGEDKAADDEDRVKLLNDVFLLAIIYSSSQKKKKRKEKNS